MELRFDFNDNVKLFRQTLSTYLASSLLFFSIAFISTSFRSNRTILPTPAGLNETQRNELDLKMSKYRHPKALYRLIVRGEF